MKIHRRINKRRPLGKRRNESAIVDEDYLDYVRHTPCCITRSTGSDPHHLVARGWAEAKRNDYTCIPLRRDKHAELEQIGPSKFEAKYGVSLWAINRQTLERYARATGKTIPERGKIYVHKLEASR